MTIERHYCRLTIFNLDGPQFTPVTTSSLDASAFVLLADILASEPGHKDVPAELWSRIRLNLEFIAVRFDKCLPSELQS